MGITSDPNDPRLGHGVDDAPIPQHEVYLVLDEMKRRNFVRPVMQSYVHAEELGGCGAVTRMKLAIAETYAAQPGHYGSTYCVSCAKHLKVGHDGEFFWCGSDHVTWEPGGLTVPSDDCVTANKLKVGT